MHSARGGNRNVGLKCGIAGVLLLMSSLVYARLDWFRKTTNLQL